MSDDNSDDGDDDDGVCCGAAVTVYYGHKKSIGFFSTSRPVLLIVQRFRCLQNLYIFLLNCI